MPFVPLPGFQGLSIFSSYIRQQRDKQGCLLPVPTVEPAQGGPTDTANGSCSTSTHDGSVQETQNCINSENWPQQTLQLMQQSGCSVQLAAAAADVPRSRAERAITKRSWATLCQQVQPCAIACSSTVAAAATRPAAAVQEGVVPADTTTAEGGSSGCRSSSCPDPPTLGVTTATHVLRFCCAGLITAACTDTSCLDGGGPGTANRSSHPVSSSTVSTWPASRVCQLFLDERINPATPVAWGKKAHLQEHTRLFCEPLQLEQLWRQVPNDVHDESAWDAAHTKVCALPVDNTAMSAAGPGDSAAVHATNTPRGKRPPTGSPPALLPILHQFVQAHVLPQQQPLRSFSTVPPAKPPAAGDATAAAATCSNGTVRTPSPQAAPALPALQVSPQPLAAEAAAAQPMSSCQQAAANNATAQLAADCTAEKLVQQHQQQLLPQPVEEPALPCPWLQQPKGPPAAQEDLTGSHGSTTFMASLQAFVVVQQADYHDNILAATFQTASSTLPAVWQYHAGLVSLEGAATAPSAGPTAGALPAGAHSAQLLQLRLPASMLPAALPMLPGSPGSRQPQQTEPGDPVAQPLRPDYQPRLSQLLTMRLAAINSTKARRQAAGPDAAETRYSVAAKPHVGRRMSRVSNRQLPAETPAVDPVASHTAVDVQEVAEVPVPACRTADANKEPQQLAAATAAPTAEGSSTCPPQEEQQDQTQPQQQQQQEKEEAVFSQMEAHAQMCDSQPSDDSCPMELSPHSLLVEVPVCLTEPPGPAGSQLLAAALMAAQAVLQPHWGAEAESEGAALSAWDATWGSLGRPPAAGSAGAPADKSATGWCTPAVLNMLSGVALKATGTAGAVAAQLGCQQEGAMAEQAGDSLLAAQGSSLQQQCNPHTLLGDHLLEHMLAVDMQLGAEGDSLLLPVVLFPDSCGVDSFGHSNGSATDGGICAELLQYCGYKQQSTAHLELYFDWSLLQPQHGLLSNNKRQRRSCSSIFGGTAAAAKRLKVTQDASAGTQWMPQGADELPDIPDCAAWLQIVLQHEGLQQLQHDLQQKPLASSVSEPTASARPGMADTGTRSAQCHVRAVLASALQLHNAPCAVVQQPAGAALPGSSCAPTAQQPQGKLGPSWPPVTQAFSVIEELAPEVAAASAAWRLACQQTEACAEAESVVPAPDTRQGAPRAAAGTAPAPATDLDFFLQLQGTLRGSKKRSSAAVATQPETKAPASAGASLGDREQPPPVAAMPQVSLSPPAVAPVKRARVSTQQQQQPFASPTTGAEAPRTSQHQGQQEAALATADLGVNGAMRGAAAAHVAATEADAAAAAAGPTLVSVGMSPSILQLLLKLQNLRQSVLSAMQCPGPELVDCLLWTDAAAQQMLLKLKARQQQQHRATGQGMSAQQRLHNKQLVVLVLISQTAACLLHYGISVAHMFLQHGLQRLPSVSDACMPALVALQTASAALEQPGPPSTRLGTAGSCSSCGGDHPKLSRLQNLVLHLHSKQRDCKLLVVAESKAFFNLYRTLSAVGVIAVQLDRDRKLQVLAQGAPQTGASTAAGHLAQHAAAASHSRTAEAQGSSHAVLPADAGVQSAWQTSVQSSLSAASCVLVTHEQLHHPCMVLQAFHVLIEYVAWEDTAAGMAAAAGPDGFSAAAVQSHVSAHFGAGRHFIFRVKEPDLEHAAAEACRAAEEAAAGPTAASPPAGPAPAAAARPSSHVDTAALAPEQQAAGPAATTSAAVHSGQQAAAGQPADTARQETRTATPAQEMPLVLNTGSSSVAKNREALYQSLLHLEEQGFVLVERLLGGSRGCPVPPGSAVGPAAVDIIITPKAALCIWVDSKLPQEREAAVQHLCRTLLALSMSYEVVFFLLELQDSMLQAVIRNSSNLWGLARAAGMRLQLLTCFSAAITQDAVLHICKETASSFWAAQLPGDVSSSSSTPHLQPPPGMSDLPTAVEAQLGACCALNPLSAAVLTSQGATLSSLFELAASDGGPRNALLHACLPPRSLQLLQVQAAALAEHIQQQRRQQEEDLLRSLQEEEEDSRHQQQQQQQQQSMPQHAQRWQDDCSAQGLVGQQGEHVTFDEQGTAGHNIDGQREAAPGMWQHMGAAPGARAGVQHRRQASYRDCQEGLQQQRQQQQQQAWQLLPDQHAAPPLLDEDGDMFDTELPGLQEQEQPVYQDERQLWPHQHSIRHQALHPARAEAAYQQQQQQSLQDDPDSSLFGVDPSRVLDDFLSRRSPGPPAAAAAGSALLQHGAAGHDVHGLHSVRGRQQRAAAAAAAAAATAGDGDWDTRLDGSADWPQQRHTAPQQPYRVPPEQGSALTGNQAHWHQWQQPQAPGSRHGRGGSAPADVFQDPWAGAAAAIDPGCFQALGAEEPGNEFLRVQQDVEDDPYWGSEVPGQLTEMQYSWEGGRQQLQQHWQHRSSSRPRVPAAHRAPDMGFLDGIDDCQAQPHRPHQPVRPLWQQQGQLPLRDEFDLELPGQAGPEQRATRHGGMFAAAARGMRQVPGDAYGGHGNSRYAAASGSYGASDTTPHFDRDDGHPGWQGAGVRVDVPSSRGFAQLVRHGPRVMPGPRTSNSSGLTVPAFMPHHNPSKQLKYKLPAGAAGVTKRKKGAKGGFQTKLCWG